MVLVNMTGHCCAVDDDGPFVYVHWFLSLLSFCYFIHLGRGYTFKAVLLNMNFMIYVLADYTSKIMLIEFCATRH